MSRKSRFRNILTRAGIPALSMIVMGFFGYYALLGPNGLLAYGDYTRQIDAKQAEFAALDKSRAELKNRVRKLDPEHADPDLVDELVRKKMNVAHPDEVIIPLD